MNDKYNIRLKNNSVISFYARVPIRKADFLLMKKNVIT